MSATRLIIIVPALMTLFAAPAPGAAEPAKNWRPPAGEIRAQALSNAIMATHPELLSVTFHGTPPGAAKIYTMFAGSYPERIGNPDDPDDIDVIVKGITIIDPRWRRTAARRQAVDRRFPSIRSATVKPGACPRPFAADMR